MTSCSCLWRQLGPQAAAVTPDPTCPRHAPLLLPLLLLVLIDTDPTGSFTAYWSWQQLRTLHAIHRIYDRPRP